MATLAALLRRPLASASGPPPVGPVPVEDLFRLRALPNEDVFLFAKRIDNSRVVREPDPKARGECWSLIGLACVLAALLMALLSPSVANTLAGYQLESLKQERQHLLDERRVLDVVEARLSSQENLQELAKGHELQTPTSGQVVHLDPKGDGKLALNRH